MNKLLLTSLLLTSTHVFAFSSLNYSINISKNEQILLDNSISLNENKSVVIFKANTENTSYLQQIGSVNQNNVKIDTRELKSNATQKETKLSISYVMEEDNIKTKLVIEEIMNDFSEDGGVIGAEGKELGSASKVNPNNVKKDVMQYEFLSVKKSNVNFNWNGLIFNIDIK